MNKNDIKKLDNRLKMLIITTILIWIYNLINSYINYDNFINSNDRLTQFIGNIWVWIMPYLFIAIIVQSIVFAISFIKSKKQIINVIILIIEICYFIFIILCCIPYSFFNLYFLNKILAYIITIISIVINIYIIILIVKKIILYKRMEVI